MAAIRLDIIQKRNRTDGYLAGSAPLQVGGLEQFKSTPQPHFSFTCLDPTWPFCLENPPFGVEKLWQKIVLWFHDVSFSIFERGYDVDQGWEKMLGLGLKHPERGPAMVQ